MTTTTTQAELLRLRTAARAVLTGDATIRDAAYEEPFLYLAVAGPPSEGMLRYLTLSNEGGNLKYQSWGDDEARDKLQATLREKVLLAAHTGTSVTLTGYEAEMTKQTHGIEPEVDMELYERLDLATNTGTEVTVNGREAILISDALQAAVH